MGTLGHLFVSKGDACEINLCALSVWEMFSICAKVRVSLSASVREGVFRGKEGEGVCVCVVYVRMGEREREKC